MVTDMTKHLKTSLGLMAALALTGCSTVKMPNIDFIKLPEFREDAVNIKDFPSVADAPTAPTDVRSAKEWDKAAKAIIKVRDDFETPDPPTDKKSKAELEAEIQSLRNEVHAYKADDPQ